ncbi:MAG: exo-alpha-sialidase [Verrucomicrobia bacterium]|nr:exo-alpha-sialidase [Verrucomicrobiota bacterium]
MRKLFALVVLLFGLTRSALALEIGDRVGPVELRALDGRLLTMTNYAERRGTMAVFLSARSVATNSETQILGDLGSRLRQRGILFVGIFPNAEETVEEVRRFAQLAGLLFPIYRDPEQKAARQFGAKVTPEAFLLDASGALIYHGAIGSTNQAGLVTSLSEFLERQPVKVSHVPARGIPIGQPQPKRETDDPFGSVAFASELIFEKIPDAPAHHCSTIAEAANGDLLVVWYGGSFESADDQTLFLSRRKKGERTWSQPEVLIRNSAQPPGNAVVFRAGGKRICIVWCRMEASRPLRRGGGWGQTRLFYRLSEDDGITWGQDKPFLGGVHEGLRNVPITLANGDLLLPLAHSFARTRDSGATWEQLGAVNAGGQPTVIERADGSLLTLLRKGPRILQSESRDAGRTWSPTTATELKNPDAGIAMTRLRNGHVVLIFNDSGMARTPLNIARSLDEGRTWETPLALESNPGEYSYPSVIQTSDGKIHATYTFRRYAIKHVELDENWLIHLHRPN